MHTHDYHALPGVSSHALITLMKSPAECWNQYLNPNRCASFPTASMRLGTLVHGLALTPNQFEREFIVADYERRSHTGKAHYARLLASGKTVVKPAELDKAREIVATLKTVPEARRLLRQGKKERTIIQPRQPGLLPLKARLDVHDEAKRQVVELKTIRDLNRITQAMDRYRYALSAAFYLDLVRGQRMVFVFVQTTPPHEVAIFKMGKMHLQDGREQYQYALNRCDDCWRSGHWPDAEPLPDFDDDPLLVPTAMTPHQTPPRFDLPVGELAL